MAEEESTPVLLVTANVGSIFEDPSVMLKIWTEEFLNTVSRLDPKFVALHCQEVGGKNYEQSMQHVQYFLELLMNSEELRLFDKVRVYLDKEYSSAENFTALGNFYFIHQTISDVLMWDFKDLCFVEVEGKMIYEGNIEEVSTKEKSKFPQDFFPECKWSRKGFLRTRWNLNGTVFDLINIHLFHDASNFIAMETFPSVYSKTRQRALEYTLDRFHNDAHGPAPFFLFGDFNFRTDTQAVIRKLSEGLEEEKVSNGKSCRVEWKDSASQEVVLRLGKKEFSHLKHQTIFNSDLWLLEFDKEVSGFTEEVFEFPVVFQPSYPFEEESSRDQGYMQTRCPAWCDRVLLSHSARPLIMEDKGVEYSLIGINTCMGDHKPVYLRGELMSEAGRLACCETRLESTGGVTFSLGEEEEVIGEDLRPVHGVRSFRGRLCSESEVTRRGRRSGVERVVVKRVESAPGVEELRVGVLREGSCRRAPSREWAPPRGGGEKVRRVLSLRRPLPRLESHHSSSDEEWFDQLPPQPKHHCCVLT